MARIQQQDSERRSAPINIRALPAQRQLIDRASALQGKTRSDFMLEAACREAEQVLADRRNFFLDDAAFAEFEAALSAPAKADEQLHKLLTTPAPWGR